MRVNLPSPGKIDENELDGLAYDLWAGRVGKGSVGNEKVRCTRGGLKHGSRKKAALKSVEL